MNDRPGRPLKSGDVYSGDILRDEYGMNAENRPHFQVTVDEVPEELRPMIPFVERWAIACDVTRGDYFDKQPEQDIAEFYHAALPYVDRIRAWVRAQPERVQDWPDAAVHFMYFLKAHAEAYQPTPEEIREREERFAQGQHRRAMKAAIEESEAAFRAKDFARVVQLLAPFEAELEKIHAAKLALAQKRV